MMSFILQRFIEDNTSLHFHIPYEYVREGTKEHIYPRIYQHEWAILG